MGTALAVLATAPGRAAGTLSPDDLAPANPVAALPPDQPSVADQATANAPVDRRADAAVATPDGVAPRPPARIAVGVAGGLDARQTAALAAIAGEPQQAGDHPHDPLDLVLGGRLAFALTDQTLSPRDLRAGLRSTRVGPTGTGGDLFVVTTGNPDGAAREFVQRLTGSR